jgi:predicted transcriptional regulator
MLADHLEAERQRRGLSVGRLAHRLRISVADYKRLLAGEPIVRYAVWAAVRDFIGYPATFESPRDRP